MELTCALIVALVGLVAGTPSGYGVKGGAGAIAKAEANSAAFAGPGALPPGAAITGSYSKSASSNSASSASSAYSSSFSFSGSGIIPPGSGLPSDITACKSGVCPYRNDALIGPNSGNTGNEGAYSGANAISAAGAANGNTPCSTGECKQSHDCQGPNCDINDRKCASGDCSSGSTTNAYDSNDIAVNTAGSAAKSSYNDKAKNSGAECLNGKCDNSKPVYGNDAPNVYSNLPSQPTNKPSEHFTTPKHSPPCTSPSCGPKDIYDKSKPSSYNVPILGPGTPPEPSDVKCTSGKCAEFPSKAPISQNSPSYPNDAAPPFSSQTSGCTSPNCAGAPSPGSLNTPGSKYLSQTQPNQPSYGSASAHSGLNPIPTSYNEPKTNLPLATPKKTLPYTGGFGGPPGILKPNDFSASSKISPSYKPNTPTLQPHEQPSLCFGGNCGSQPSPVKYNPSSNPSCVSGNCGTSANTSPYVPSNPVGSYQPKAPTEPKNSIPCTSGSCGSYPGQPLNQYGSSDSSPKPQHVPSSGTHSSACSNGSCPEKPSYASPPAPPNSPQYVPMAPPSFGGPEGTLKPNDYNTPFNAPSSYGPKPTGPTPVSYHPVTSSCSSGNCGSQQTQSKPQYNPIHSYKPIPTAPVFGFNGPAASQPIDYSAPYSVPSSQPSRSYKPQCSTGQCESQPQQYNPLIHGVLKPDNGKPNLLPPKPSNPYNPSTASCSDGNCGSQSAPSSPQYNPSFAYKPTLPPSGFGGPAGVLKPNDYNSPPNVPPSSNPSNYNPTSPCSTGSCGSPISKPGQSSPQYNPSLPYKPTLSPSGFGGLAGVLKPNDYNSPPNVSPSSNPGNYNPASPCSTGSCGSPISKPGQSSPQYNPSLPYKPTLPSSGFGGPAGVLKPNDHAPSPNPQGSYKPSPCSSGYCGSQPEQTSPLYSPLPAYKPTSPTYEFGAPTGILKPTDYAPSSNPQVSHNPSACSSGNCGSQSGPISPQYSPLPAYKPPTPAASGFGAPAGILKPTDYAPSSNPQVSHNPSPCSSGNCGSQSGQISPQYSPLPAYKPTAPPSSGFGAPAGILKPNDYNAPSGSPIAKPAGSYNPSSCSTGTCGSQPGQSTTHYNPLPAHEPNTPNSGFGEAVNPENYNGTSSSPASSYKPTGPEGSYNPATSPCSTGNCGSPQPQLAQLPLHNQSPATSPGFGGPAGILKPNDYSAPFNSPASNLKPTSQAGLYNAAPCTSGSCHSPNGPITGSTGSSSSYHPTSCTTGKCGGQPNHNIQSSVAGVYSGAGAIASAKAVAYSGGFGGPPGLLKPYDRKAGSGATAGALSGSNGDSRGFYGKSLDGSGVNGAAGSGAQAGAIAGASAGAFSGALSGRGIPNGKGCTGGCGGDTTDSGAVAGAVAKSVATAGAGTYGGSFASSSASAHASAGTATKGGYGR